MGDIVFKKKAFVVSVVFVALTVLIWGVNYIYISCPLSKVINEDYRNNGISMVAHYGYYVNPSTLIINMKEISGSNSRADVFRVLIQYAEKLENSNFDWIILQSKGKDKFMLKGAYFKNLGKEYGIQNPVYTMRTFPENVYTMNKSHAFDSWTGGLIGVLNKQIEEFNQFHYDWYLEDM